MAVDRDATILDVARKRLRNFSGRVEFIHGSYDEVLESLEDESIDAVLMDLGFSSFHLECGRGFSVKDEGRLDMRYDTRGGIDAAELVMRASEKELADIIRTYGEERHAFRIARAIVKERRSVSRVSAAWLADVVHRAVPHRRSRIHPATRTFQALRIAVNDELGRLDRALEVLPSKVSLGGRVAVISYHSLEDRRVKHAMKKWSVENRFSLLTKKPIVPDEEEVLRNRRSRSARLRVAERSA